jgi:hypothetical protein
MQRFEVEARQPKPPDFDVWLLGLGDVADTCGAWALIGAWRKSATEHCRYLVSQPGLWEGLIARGQYADRARYEAGVVIGRGVGL